jgi:hypothetical protein
MHIPDIITALNLHPDAKLPPQYGREATGLNCITVFPSGGIYVEYHWGMRSFKNQSELENWLAGIVPTSWQQ